MVTSKRKEHQAEQVRADGTCAYHNRGTKTGDYSKVEGAEVADKGKV
tara:strand:+ start:230 stop:370 length:141 start_codon:yes stop_codon:yes gene_type:complete